MPSKIPSTGPLTHMQSVTHTHKEHSHTLNTGYCNWNKVQRDYDLTPSRPVILPLLHSHSFFFLFPSVFLAFPPPSNFLFLPGRTFLHGLCRHHTNRHAVFPHTQTHTLGITIVMVFTIFSFYSTSFRFQR